MRDKILAMEAGRELDILIAEKVMNWISDFQCWNDESGRIRTIEPTSFGSFQPSTDISAAWEVAEKFNLSGFLVNYLNDNPFGDGWRCVINHEHHVRGCKTAPEAICKAALLAVMES